MCALSSSSPLLQGETLLRGRAWDCWSLLTSWGEDLTSLLSHHEEKNIANLVTLWKEIGFSCLELCWGCGSALLLPNKLRITDELEQKPACRSCSSTSCILLLISDCFLQLFPFRGLVAISILPPTPSIFPCIFSSLTLPFIHLSSVFFSLPVPYFCIVNLFLSACCLCAFVLCSAYNSGTGRKKPTLEL